MRSSLGRRRTTVIRSTSAAATPFYLNVTGVPHTTDHRAFTVEGCNSLEIIARTRPTFDRFMFLARDDNIPIFEALHILQPAPSGRRYNVTCNVTTRHDLVLDNANVIHD